MKKDSLKKYAYLSIAAALITIGLKFYAYFYTGSMGLFSDALESCVNLLAAVVALIMIHISEKPADEGHEFGHTKAEYFSSAIEGGLILVAAFSIIWSAAPRLLEPQPIENVGLGVLISLSASLVNLGVALVLIKNGKKNNSLLLEADGKHLMTDVWTSVGVITAIFIVKLTGFLILDPIIAIIVALNIVWTGFQLLKRSANGLMDASISESELKIVTDYLNELKTDKIDFHSLMTRQAGQRKFISLHLLVPGEWSVQQGHDYAENIEETIEDMFSEPVTVSTHIEPIEDPASMRDIGIDRKKLV
ncbi:MAG: cation transporter [Paludibacteraceae bacterium]|nr:cation transporter [Paludibacteraceae bacterium]